MRLALRAAAVSIALSIVATIVIEAVRVAGITDPLGWRVALRVVALTIYGSLGLAAGWFCVWVTGAER